MKFNPRWAVTALSVIALGVSSLAHAAPISGQGTWETTLQGRDLDGNLATVEAYYDTALNITWLANANYAGTTMNWTTANTWATNLNPYGSDITGWRLPTVTDTGTSGCNFAYSGTDCGYNVNTATGEMAHMFYTTLGDKSYYDTSGSSPQAGWGLTNTGPFSNVSVFYWAATEYAPDMSNAWSFDFSLGNQNVRNKTDAYANYLYGWAVHSGDVGATVAAVPVSTTVWLFGSGLVGLIGFARRKTLAV